MLVLAHGTSEWQSSPTASDRGAISTSHLSLTPHFLNADLFYLFSKKIHSNAPTERRRDFSSTVRPSASDISSKNGSLVHHRSHRRGTRFSAAPGSVPGRCGPWGAPTKFVTFCRMECLLRRPLPRWQAGRQILSHATTSLRAIPRAALEQRWGAQRLLFECKITPVNLNRHSSSSARGGVGAGQTFKVRRDRVLLRSTETPRRGPDSNFCDLKGPSEAQHKEIS